MVKKAVLAEFIRAGRHDLAEWYHFMPTIKGLRVKDVGSQGEVQISLDDKGWFTPHSWLANYQAEFRERLAEELKVAEVVLSTEQKNGLLLQHVTPVTNPDYASFRDEELRIMSQMASDSKYSPGQRLVNILDYIFTFKFNCGHLTEQVRRIMKENPWNKDGNS